MAPQAIIINSTGGGLIKTSTQGELSFKTVFNGLEVIVGSKVTFIPKSTTISRNASDIYWLNSNDNADICTLKLINSTQSDITTIHRLLSSVSAPKHVLHLPLPSQGPATSNNNTLNTRTPSCSSNNFRNSLVLVDEDEKPIAVMDLNDSSTNFAGLINQNKLNSARGEELAKTVDDISNHLVSRYSKLDNENRGNTGELGNGRLAKDGSSVDSFATTLKLLSVTSSAPVTNVETPACSNAIIIDTFPTGSEISQPGSFTSSSSISSLPNSSISIPSIATRGTHDRDMSDISEAETTGETNYATATEGGEGIDSRRSSSATFESCWTAQENIRPNSVASSCTVILATSQSESTSSILLTDQFEDDVTPQQSTFNATNSFLNHPLSPSYTGSNAVLLEFLGDQSTFTTRQITEDEIEQKGLIRATAEIDSTGSWKLISAGLLNAITDLKNWLGIESWFAKSSSIDHKPKSVEEIGKSRLSVIYFDEQGFGRKAYVASRNVK